MFKWTCLATVAAMFPLLWMGGLVTSMDAGMAVPDWPTTFGKNLFLYPISTWFFGPWDVFVEHGHRLLGALVGLFSVVVIFVGRDERSRMFSVWSVILCGGVLLQGLFGGMRVVFRDAGLAFCHGIFGQAVFCGYAALTSSAWGLCGRVGVEVRQECALLSLSMLQLVFGALLRHLAVVSDGQWFLGCFTIHMVVGAILLARLASVFWLRHGEWFIRLIGLLVCLQVGMGVATLVVKYGVPGGHLETGVICEKSFIQSMLATSHVAGGAMLSAVFAGAVARERKVVCLRGRVCHHVN